MSFPYENVDESILRNMGDGLSDVISGTQYQVGSPDALPEGTNLSGIGDPNAPADIGQYIGNVTQPGQVVANQGVVSQIQPTTQPAQPAVDVAAIQAERQRLEQIAYNASMQRIEAEEAAFQASIANLDEETREMRVLERELEQQREVNNWLNTQVTGLRGQMTQAQQEAYQRQQEASKRQWGILMGHRYNLPYENEAVRTALLGAESPEHMEAIAQNLVQIVNQGARVTSQNRFNSGILAAGSGATAPTAPQGPKPRSGDISGLIASRSPQTVNWG
jgi:hypothetical protein